jgi:hypothetical protein
MDQHLDLFAALAAPFENEEVRARPQAGRQLPYVTARTVMNRLDDVLGPSNWWDEYIPQENSVICRLTIRLPDGTTLTKSDAGGYAGMPDSGDDDKSGFSDAFKRAAVKFGIGRYLYRDGVPRFVLERSEHAALTASSAHRRPRSLPSPTEPAQPAASAAGPTSQAPGPPQTGKALFACIKHHDESHGSGLLGLISDWARRQDYPGRMIQWNRDQVERAYAQVQDSIRESRNTDAEQEPPHHAPKPAGGGALDSAGREAAKRERPAAPSGRGGERSGPRSGRSR